MSDLQEAKEKARGRAVKIAKVSGYKLGAFGYMFDAGWNAATEHHAAKVAEMEAEIVRLRSAAAAVIHHFYRYDNCQCGVPISLHGNLTMCSISSNGSSELSALRAALNPMEKI